MERIDSDLSYGGSRSEWIRQVTEYGLINDSIVDELGDLPQGQERTDLVFEAVYEKVDELKQDSQ